MANRFYAHADDDGERVTINFREDEILVSPYDLISQMNDRLNTMQKQLDDLNERIMLQQQLIMEALKK